MKYFFNFLIICCFGVSTILGKKWFGDKRDEIAQQCQQEMNLDQNQFIFSRLKSDDRQCISACLIRASADKEYIRSSDKATLHNILLQFIDRAYKGGFANEEKSFTQEDIVKKVNQCYDTESTECQYTKCVKLVHSPMDTLIQFTVNNHLEGNLLNF